LAGNLIVKAAVNGSPMLLPQPLAPQPPPSAPTEGLLAVLLSLAACGTLKNEDPFESFPHPNSLPLGENATHEHFVNCTAAWLGPATSAVCSRHRIVSVGDATGVEGVAPAVQHVPDVGAVAAATEGGATLDTRAGAFASESTNSTSHTCAAPAVAGMAKKRSSGEKARLKSREAAESALNELSFWPSLFHAIIWPNTQKTTPHGKNV
jgi:hypothetical protein